MTLASRKELVNLLNLLNRIIDIYPSARIIETRVLPPASCYIRFWDLDSDRVIEWMKIGNRVKENIL